MSILDLYVSEKWNLISMKNKKSMQKICNKLGKINVVRRSRQHGITIVEYALAAALVSAAVLVAFGALGNQIGAVFNNIIIGIG